MIRTLWVVLSACCVAAVLSEALGLGFLWSQGLLSARRLREMRDVFAVMQRELATGIAFHEVGMRTYATGTPSSGSRVRVSR